MVVKGIVRIQVSHNFPRQFMVSIRSMAMYAISHGVTHAASKHLYRHAPRPLCCWEPLAKCDSEVRDPAFATKVSIEV
jgi:hypothetical protein